MGLLGLRATRGGFPPPAPTTPAAGLHLTHTHTPKTPKRPSGHATPLEGAGTGERDLREVRHLFTRRMS